MQQNTLCKYLKYMYIASADTVIVSTDVKNVAAIFHAAKSAL